MTPLQIVYIVQYGWVYIKNKLDSLFRWRSGGEPSLEPPFYKKLLSIPRDIYNIREATTTTKY